MTNLTKPAPGPRSNAPIQSVEELSQALKRTLEDVYGYVRVRGEVSGARTYASGHTWLTLKEGEAVLNAVCWKGAMARLSVRPENGMEVIASGRVTGWPNKSEYRLVIEALELAGEGALLRLLEERRRRLQADGLFDQARKRRLPSLPRVIGVVTSPDGAVFRDILHRLADRFPTRVLLWPVPVQGEGAASKIAAAIQGLGQLPVTGAVPRPDVIIVARGGGSLEDLMAFNEEEVVRAAADCPVPLISAIGHETDWTLIDYAADVRAPTPTAAAEMAVPVRMELIAQVTDRARRLDSAWSRLAGNRRLRLEGLARGLGDPRRRLEDMSLRLDDRGERLRLAILAQMDRGRTRVRVALARIRHPQATIDLSRQRMAGSSGVLRRAMAVRFDAASKSMAGVLARLRLDPIRAVTQRGSRDLLLLRERLDSAGKRCPTDAAAKLTHQARLLESLSPNNLLSRGYACVTLEDGRVMMRASEAPPGARVNIRFQDATRPARLLDAMPGGAEGDH